MRTPKTCVSLVLTISALMTLTRFACAESGEAVEKQILYHRMQIKDASLSLSSLITEGPTQVSEVDFVAAVNRANIWFRAPSCFRADMAYALKPHETPTPSGVFSRTATEWISAHRRTKDEWSVAVDSIKTVPHQTLFDPRLIGIAVTEFASWSNSRLADELFLCHRGTSSVSEGKLDGVETVVVSGQYKIGKTEIRHRTWVSPRQDFNVLKRDIEGGGIIQSVASNVVDTDGVWFPARVVVTTTSAEDGQTLYREEISVSKPKFNRGISDSLFGIESIGLDVGTQLVSYGDHYIWNGEVLLPDLSVSPIGGLAQRRGHGRFRSGFLALNATICLLLGCYLLWRRKSSSRT